MSTANPISNQIPNRKEIWLTPSECANRTGLTVRALRVYERFGLVAATRLTNGWRRYGTQEIERLNTITVLKAVGMSLAQIRELIADKAPSLQRILEIQVNTWKTKRSDAERGLALAEAAIKRVENNRSLSVDELCKLIRGVEMSDHLEIARNLVSETITPEEQALLRARWAENPEILAAMKASSKGQMEIFKKLRTLMEAGADPASQEVQQLLQERIDLITHHKVFESMVSFIEWNRTLALKIYSIDAKYMKKLRAAPQTVNQSAAVLRPDLMDFLIAATKESDYWKCTAEILQEARAVMMAGHEPSSHPAQQLATRFNDVHRKFNLEPNVYEKIMPYITYINDGWPDWLGPETEPVWNFLTSALNEQPDNGSGDGPAAL